MSPLEIVEGDRYGTYEEVPGPGLKHELSTSASVGQLVICPGCLMAAVA